MTTSNRIYLDYAASAPLRPKAKEAWLSYHEQPCGVANPNSLHTLGREASKALDEARRTMARCLGGNFRPGDIIFTSGGTESNNMALLGMAEGARKRNSKLDTVVLSAIEHDSVLDVATLLRGRGFKVVFVSPNAEGVIEPEALDETIAKAVADAQTQADLEGSGQKITSCIALVSVMAANNETGVIQPIEKLARRAHRASALFHCDAIQAFGHIPLELEFVDAVSIAGHKIGAPVGTGVLALRSRTPFIAQNLGGGQEGGKRPGTQDVAGAVALAAASEVVMGSLTQTREQVAALARHVYERLVTGDGKILAAAGTAVGEDRLPNIVSIMVPSLDSETMVLKLDEMGFEVSAGSACSSGSLDPSHVLSAMGIARDNALGSLRISFDERVTLGELDAFCDALLSVVGGAHEG